MPEDQPRQDVTSTSNPDTRVSTGRASPRYGKSPVGEVLGNWRVTAEVGRASREEKASRGEKVTTQDYKVEAACVACGTANPKPFYLHILRHWARYQGDEAKLKVSRKRNGKVYKSRERPRACPNPDCRLSLGVRLLEHKKRREVRSIAHRRRAMTADMLAGKPFTAIAAEYGVSKQRVAQILRGNPDHKYHLNDRTVRAWLASLPRGLLLRGLATLPVEDAFRVLAAALEAADPTVDLTPPPEIEGLDPFNPPEDPV